MRAPDPLVLKKTDYVLAFSCQVSNLKMDCDDLGIILLNFILENCFYVRIFKLSSMIRDFDMTFTDMPVFFHLETIQTITVLKCDKKLLLDTRQCPLC